MKPKRRARQYCNVKPENAAICRVRKRLSESHAVGPSSAASRGKMYAIKK